MVSSKQFSELGATALQFSSQISSIPVFPDIVIDIITVTAPCSVKSLSFALRRNIVAFLKLLFNSLKVRHLLMCHFLFPLRVVKMHT